MKKSFVILSICFLGFSNLFAQNWENKSISDSIIFHKITNNEDILWAVDYGNGQLFKSTDNGEEWTKKQQLNLEYLEVIQFTSPEIGYTCGDFGAIYKTIDGGEKWVEIGPKIDNRIAKNHQDTSSIDGIDGNFTAYYQLHFENDTNGFVWGFNYNPKKGFRESYTRFFYTTKNGGADWNYIEYTKEIQDSLYNHYAKKTTVRPINIGTNYYYDNSHIFTTDNDKKQKFFKYSKDGGQNWELSPLPTIEGRWMVRNIVFLSLQEGYIFGGTLGDTEKAIMLKTEDGGISWKIEKSDWTHIHHASIINGYLWVSGKKGLLQRWKVE